MHPARPSSSTRRAWRSRTLPRRRPSMSGRRQPDAAFPCNWQAERLAFCQSVPNTPGHALAQHLSRLGDSVPQKLLRLVYVGRMCLAIAIYLSAALKIRVAAPLDILATSLMLV